VQGEHPARAPGEFQHASQAVPASARAARRAPRAALIVATLLAATLGTGVAAPPALAVGTVPTVTSFVPAVKTWPSTVTRTIKVVVQGTGGRPRADVDAFVVLK
jgi:hypothetical protein